MKKYIFAIGLLFFVGSFPAEAANAKPKDKTEKTTKNKKKVSKAGKDCAPTISGHSCCAKKTSKFALLKATK